MKYKEVKQLSLEEAKSKVLEVKEEYRKLRFANAISPIENLHSIKDKRRLIAKLKTYINENKNTSQTLNENKDDKKS